MFLLFVISLAIIFYYICMEFDKPSPPEVPLTGECPGCAERIVTGWLVCPQCKTVLRETCLDCGKVHDSWVRYCPWCCRQNQSSAV